MINIFFFHHKEFNLLCEKELYEVLFGSGGALFESLCCKLETDYKAGEWQQ